MISIPQIRAARGLIGWSQSLLAEKAGLSLPTVKRYETASPLKVSEIAIAAMEAALIEAGVIFIEENGEGAGVRLRKHTDRREHPQPVGPATDAIKMMDAAIETHSSTRKKKK